MHRFQLFIVVFLLFSPVLKATPNLYVPLKELTLVSKNLTLTIFRDTNSDRVKSVKIKSPDKSFTISSEVFESAYGVNLQDAKLSQTIDLTLGPIDEYQLYIPYELHSIDGSEPPESQRLKTQKLVVYFNHREVVRIITK